MRIKENSNRYQHELTYSSYVRTRVVILKTCRRRWVIGRNGERRSGISTQTARHDDDDDNERSPEDRKGDRMSWGGIIDTIQTTATLDRTEFSEESWRHEDTCPSDFSERPPGNADSGIDNGRKKFSWGEKTKIKEKHHHHYYFNRNNATHSYAKEMYRRLKIS